VAARGEHGFASDVTRVSSDGGDLVVVRSAYGGKLEAELDFPGRDTVLLLLRTGTFEPAEAGGGSPDWRDVQVELGEARSEHVEFREVEAGDVDITKADFLLSVGRGIEDKDNLEQFEELAERMGATLSVSRPLVDAGWVSNARQVGQSGKTVKPKVYLALGISGAVQHLAGMKNADTIIAVNSDPEAPIFNVAHYGVVADLFDIAGQLEQQSG
jgi:electron transfer flavoprotein alpha subunit